jgi:hypothetical protein
VLDLQELFTRSTQKAAPDAGALQRQHARQRRRSVGVKVGAFTVAAALSVGAIAFLLMVRSDRDTTTPADEPSVVSSMDPAKDVARSFLDAFGAFDAERAMTYVADDADFTGMGGFPEAGSEGLSMLTSFLEAFGWNQTITSCEALPAAMASDTTVVCAFEWHGLRSDEIGRGPFSDSEFVFTVRDSEIVEAAWYWNIQRFSRQMWDPFAAWVSETYPDDVELMYQDGQTEFRLSPESIRLWDRHSREYADQVLASAGE